MSKTRPHDSRLTRRRFISRTAAVASSVAVLPSGSLRSGAPGKIPVGQIGVGHAHADGKMRAYRQSPEWHVVGVVEPDEELRRRAERSEVYRGLRWMTRDELLGTPGLRAVAIETRVQDLLDNAEAAIDAGQHIHLDKPAGASLPHFRRIIDRARRRKLTIQLGYMYRYNPAIVLMRELLEKGWLGEPFEVHTVMSKVVGRGSRAALARFDGGLMFELGCHIIDLVVKTLGRPDEVLPFKQHVSPIDDGLADNTLAVLRYPRALATVKSSGVEVEGFARRHFVVCGSEGTCHVQPLDAPHVQLALSRDRGKYRRGTQEVRFGDYPRYVGDAADLARIVRGEKEPDFSLDHELTVQETVLRASGMPVD